jgi:trigger factor
MSSEAPALDVQVEDAGPCSKVLKIKVPASRVDREIEETYKNVQKAVQFPGFRPGKAPRKLVEARLGERVMQEVLERLVQTVYDEAVDSTKLKTIGNPRLKDPAPIARGADYHLSIDVDVRPEFEIPKLEELTATRPAVVVSDSDVEAEIKRLRDERATVADAGEDPLAEHGVATLHVKISVEGESIIDAGDVEWQHPSDVLGGMLIEGLASGLVGKKKGDLASFKEKLPADFRDEKFRGKEAQIELRVDGVQRVTLPPIDDAFAAEMDFDSLDEMKADLKKDLERRAAVHVERLTDEAVAEALLAAAPFDVPPSLVEAESGRMLNRYEMQLRQQGVDEATLPKLIEEAQSQAQTKVKHDLRLSFLLDKIAHEKKILVTENETRQELAAMAARYQKSLPEMEEYMERNRLLPSLRSELRDRKTLAELRKIVKVVEAPAESQAPGIVPPGAGS